MRRFLKACLMASLAVLALGLAGGAYWAWRAGGVPGMAAEAGDVASRSLEEWGRAHPELATSLRRHLAEAAGKPDADLGDLHQGIDAWLSENADELARWQGLTLAEDEDDLVRVLQLRRGLTRRLTEGLPGGGSGEVAPAPEPGVLEIHEGDGAAEGVGEAYSEPGLEIRPGDPATP